MEETDDTSGLSEPERKWLARVTDPSPLRREAAGAWGLAPRSTEELDAQVRTIQNLTAVPITTAFRRGLFMWLRVYSLERKAGGKQSRVNIRFPIPLPLLGLLLPWRMSKRQAVALLNQVYASPDGAALAERALASHMAFEFVHVEEANPKTGAWEYVVIGLE